MRSLLAWVAACAFALAFLHIAVFLLGLVGVILTTRATYRCVKSNRSRFRVVVEFIAAWTVFYFLIIGPFIAVSEAERKWLDRSYLGPLGIAFRPVIVVAALPRICTTRADERSSDGPLPCRRDGTDAVSITSFVRSSFFIHRRSGYGLGIGSVDGAGRLRKNAGFLHWQSRK